MHVCIHLPAISSQYRARVLELEGRVSELQCDNLRMEQRLLDMEYSSFSATRRIEGGGGSLGGGGGMTLIDDVLRDYSRRTQLVVDDHQRSSDVDDVHAKRKSIVDVENVWSEKVWYGMHVLQCCLVCMYSSHTIMSMTIPCCCCYCVYYTSDPGASPPAYSYQVPYVCMYVSMHYCDHAR